MCTYIVFPLKFNCKHLTLTYDFINAKMTNKLPSLHDSKNRPWESLVKPISRNKICDFIQQGVLPNFRFRGLNSSDIYFNCSYANIDKGNANNTEISSPILYISQ